MSTWRRSSRPTTGPSASCRYDVQYFRCKDFEQSYEDDAKSRLGGMPGALSTHMDAALRHAGYHLTQQNAQKRLVLLHTGGEPADIDECEPQYLRHETKKAVRDLATQGVYYCLTLALNADRYVARSFGENDCSMVDNVGRLPERLPNVFAAQRGSRACAYASVLIVCAWDSHA